MNKKTLRTSIAAAVGGAVLLAGLLIGASFALAQDTEEPEVAEESTGDGAPHRHGFRFFGDLDVDLEELREQLESGATLDEALDGLGLNLEELAGEALDEAFAHIDEMVADGTMTQERADSIKEMLESIDLSEGFPFGMGGFRFDGEFPDFGLDGMPGPRGHGHGFGFFGHHGCDRGSSGEDASLDA